jgi:hypothetical protein
LATCENLIDLRKAELESSLVRLKVLMLLMVDREWGAPLPYIFESLLERHANAVSLARANLARAEEGD